ncbi:hypothetical protein GCM10018952_02770 [Streptosporangium vulgare]
MVAAFAGRDGALVFQVVNRVIEGGHDPRRFAMDLLERFRDLVILANVPEAATSGLLDRPGDELERLQVQAASMGPAELTRAAEILNAGLIEMRGAASPRLLLELMCARILLPGAAQGEAALLARLERLERGGVVAAPAPLSPQAPATVPVIHAAPPPQAESPVVSATPAAPAERSGGKGDTGDDWPVAVRPGAPAQGQQGQRGQEERPPAPAQQAPGTPAPADTATASGSGAGTVQQAWPQVLAALKRRSIVVWANVNTNAQVVGVEGKVVTLGFAQVGAMRNFTGGGKDAVVAAVLQEVLGGTWKVEAVVGGGPAPSGGGRPPAPRQPPAPQHPAPQNQAPQTQAQQAPQAPAPQSPSQSPAPGQAPADSREAPPRQAPPATDESWPDAPLPEDPGSPPPPSSMPSPGLAAARSAARAAAQAGPKAAVKTGAKAVAWPDAIPDRGTRGTAPDADEVDPLNDADADVDALTGMALLQRELGGQVIGEIDHT